MKTTTKCPPAGGLFVLLEGLGRLKIAGSLGNIVAKILAEIHIQILAHLVDFHHGVVVDRNAVFHEFLFGLHFLFTVGINAGLAVSLGRIPQLLQICRKMCLNPLGIAEDGGSMTRKP